MGFETRLAGVLTEFARTLVTDFPVQAILDHLVVRIVDVLEVGAAGVTLISPGADPRYVAASDDSALRFEKLQSSLGEGPCITAWDTGRAVLIPDLHQERRFPLFAPHAIEAGMAAVFTFPLRYGDTQLGALDLYRSTPGPLDDQAVAAAQTLADVATAYLLNAQARSDLEKSSELSLHTSLHDALTGLPNRTLLVQRLDHAILRCRRSHKMVALLYADLDHFKAVNDTYGHRIGDELLVAVARRLTGLLRAGDTLARMAGDEFVILCEDLDDTTQIGHLAERIGAALAEPFALTGVEITVSASVGITFAGHGEDVPEQVLQDADTAMYQAKRRGGARYGTIDLGEKQRTEHRAGLSRDLSGAVARGEMEVAYQPIVSTVGGHVTGVEALLRWNHPLHGVIEAGTAVSVAEHAGLIGALGRWVLERACLDRRRWAAHGHDRGLPVSVNVSPVQLVEPGFAPMVASVLAETGTDPGLLTLEVTETAYLSDSDRALEAFRDLRALGVVVALDDFGTGYSSLSYLRRFPVDCVKIDQVFIADLGDDPVSRLITKAIVGLAHSLGLRVVAEGVESSAQFREIAALECDEYQGFYFSAPTSADRIEAVLAGAPA